MVAADALATAKTWVELVGSIVTTTAVAIAGLWFLFRRTLSGNLQIQVTHQTTVNAGGTRLATVRIALKNIGQTRIFMDIRELGIEPIVVPDDADPLLVVPTGNVFRMPSTVFPQLAALEPGEEVHEDVAIVLGGASLYAVGVRFEGRSIRTARWSAMAIVDTAASGTAPSAADRVSSATTAPGS